MKMLVLGATLALVLVSSTFAGTLGVDFATPGNQNSTSMWSLGFQFQANTAAPVTGLGLFDYGQDGLAGPQQVGLWDAGGTLLASVFVDNSDALQGFWRFAQISPVTLTPGARYYVASQGGEGYTYNTGGFTVNPNITFIQDAWHFRGDNLNNPLSFPDRTDGITAPDGGAFFGGNIEFDTAGVPEPSSLALFGLGAALIGYGRRRRRS